MCWALRNGRRAVQGKEILHGGKNWKLQSIVQFETHEGFGAAHESLINCQGVLFSRHLSWAPGRALGHQQMAGLELLGEEAWQKGHRESALPQESRGCQYFQK